MLRLTDPGYWRLQGENALRVAEEERLRRATTPAPARNVVLFVGDGMGLSTVTAARILRGQQLGRPGEETQLTFETFPNLGLAKVSEDLFL